VDYTAELTSINKALICEGKLGTVEHIWLCSALVGNVALACGR